jgi:hypothetical protein
MKNFTHFFAAVILVFTAISFASAQQPDNFGKEIQLPVATVFERGNTASCLHIENRVYNEESWKRLFDFAQCAEALKNTQIDVKKQTLVGYHIGGDCHMTMRMNLYRDDARKLYTLVIRNIYGGCRAGGWRYGFYELDKMPADYYFKFVEYLVEDDKDRNLRLANDSGETWSADGKQVIDALISVPKP